MFSPLPAPSSFCLCYSNEPRICILSPPPPILLKSLTTLCFFLRASDREREGENVTAKNLHKITAFRCAFSIRRSEMNVLYISADCGGVNQSSFLHTSTGPVDGARALLETRALAQGRSVTFPPLLPSICWYKLQ